MANDCTIRLSKRRQVVEIFTKIKNRTSVGALSKVIGADKTFTGANGIEAGANTKSIGADKTFTGAKGIELGSDTKSI